MARGCKPKSEWRIGTEHEKHVYRKNPIRPVQYEGDDGIAALLEGIRKRTGWNYFYDRDNPIGLRNLTPVGGISLEPGGQFELSGAPQTDMHGAAEELDDHLADCRAVGEPLNIHFLSLGVTPQMLRGKRFVRLYDGEVAGRLGGLHCLHAAGGQ